MDPGILPRSHSGASSYFPVKLSMEDIYMKKIFIAITCMIGIASYIYGMGDSTEAKKTVCDKGCAVAYDACLKAAQKVTEKITNPSLAETKKKAEETTCQKAKDYCVKKCTPAPTQPQTQTK
jgi:hypothetical protein